MENNSMDKKDWIWVAIRIFGIYLLVLAITGLPGLVSSAYSTYVFRDMAKMYDSMTQDDNSDAMNALNNMFGKMYATSVSSFAGSVVRVVLFSIIGIYLLRSGKLIFKLIYPGATSDHSGETG